MAILRSTKSIINKRKHAENYFNNLPAHLVSDILARVASTSFTDLINAKSTCKDLLQASSEDQIFERVSIDSLPVIPWKKSKNSDVVLFLEKCKDAGNPESLFRRGMIDYFSYSRPESGLENLRKANEKGHPAAKYVYCVIMVCYGGKFREEGLKIGCDLKMESSMVALCREKVRKVLKAMWVRNYIVKINGGEVGEEMRLRTRNCSCAGKTTSFSGYAEIKRRKKAVGWRDEEEFDDGAVSCDGCLWDVEAVRFCYMLKTGRFSSRFRY